MSILKDKEVTEQEWWKNRLQEVIDGGCSWEDLQDLRGDLEMNNLTGRECYMVPSVILEIPVCKYDDEGKLLESSVEEVEDILQEISGVKEVCGYKPHDNRWVMSYIPK